MCIHTNLGHWECERKNEVQSERECNTILYSLRMCGLISLPLISKIFDCDTIVYKLTSTLHICMHKQIDFTVDFINSFVYGIKERRKQNFVDFKLMVSLFPMCVWIYHFISLYFRYKTTEFIHTKKQQQQCSRR